MTDAGPAATIPTVPRGPGRTVTGIGRPVEDLRSTSRPVLVLLTRRSLMTDPRSPVGVRGYTAAFIVDA
jgi:hypothetical protein